MAMVFLDLMSMCTHTAWCEHNECYVRLATLRPRSFDRMEHLEIFLGDRLTILMLCLCTAFPTQLKVFWTKGRKDAVTLLS